MKKIIGNIIYGIAIMILIGGGIFNILSVRPDIVANLRNNIGNVIWLMKEYIHFWSCEWSI